MTSLIQGQLLIVGYARNHSISYLPKEIEELIHAFWSDFSGVWWKIKGKQLKKTFNLKKMRGGRIYGRNQDLLRDENHISGQQSEIRSICITPIIYNHYVYKDRVRVMCFGLLFNIPSNVKSIELYYKLYCKETNAVCEKMSHFKNSGTWGSMELKIVLHAHEGMHRLSELNVMHFCEIHSIEYKKEAIEKSYFRDGQMLQHFEYEWKLNENEMRMLKRGPDDYERKDIESDLFNDRRFKLIISPKCRSSLWGNLRLRTYSLNIFAIEVKAEVVIGTKSVCSTSGHLYSHKCLELSTKFYDFARKIGSDCSIHGRFEITAIWVEDGPSLNKIVGAEMAKYGIVLDSPNQSI